MKQKDIAMLAGALIVGIIFSIFVDKYAFSNSNSQNTEVDVVPSISTAFSKPPSQYFNSGAIDPTQIININSNNSQQPFSSTSP